MSEAFRITDERSLSAALQWIVDYPKPCAVKLSPLQTGRLTVLRNKFEAKVNEVAKFKGWNIAQREEFKKDCKVNWGKVIVRHDMITGGKAFKIPSISEYAEDEVGTLIGELEVWCAEQGIPLS